MNPTLKTALIAIALLVLPVAMLAQGRMGKGEKPAAKPEEAKEELKKEEAKPAELPEDSLYRLSAKTLDGKDANLKDYQGKVVLVVNVASKCGYTPQYKGLEKLYRDYKDKGFFVLGFPSNDFGRQEPGSAEDIQKLCKETYDVTFPMFEKLQTKEGEGQSPIYANLQKQSGSLPSWNFCKYLVGKDGKVIKFYASKTTPEDESLRKAIDEALAAGNKEAAPEPKETPKETPKDTPKEEPKDGK